MSGFGFSVEARSDRSAARAGLIQTPHGAIETPAFIFCATKASIKGLHPLSLPGLGVQVILSNTYHLMLQPGAELVGRMGGLHAFMGWSGPMLTDSGGFQIFSMGHGGVVDEIKGRHSTAREKSLLSLTEEGASFRAYTDGRKHVLTPESSIDIQRRLGADLIVVLDECTPFHVEREYTAKSMALSHRWADRSLARFTEGENDPALAGRQALYGIVQGGVYPDLRRESAEFVASRPFFGSAVGGSLGAEKAQMVEVVSYCMPYLPKDRPVHLLGIGGIDDIFAGVRLGIDTFDCVSPTRIARHGWALARGVPGNRMNLRNARFRDDPAELDPGIKSLASGFSRAYIHHLIKAGELLGMQLLSAHNVAVMTRLMDEIREAIRADSLDALEAEWVAADGA